MNPFRCFNCNKLLGKIEGKAEIKCPKCKTMNYYVFVPKSISDKMNIQALSNEIGDINVFMDLPDGVCMAERLSVEEIRKRYPTK